MPPSLTNPSNPMSDIHLNLSQRVLAASMELRDSVNSMQFAEPTTHVYNPLDYAWEPYADYVQKFARPNVDVVFLGMNPGPWGMAQVGVPFGEIEAVRNWMGVQGTVTRPQYEHAKRPIDGFACQRSEVSGRRLWGLFRDRFGSADKFFQNHFVLNYCPLVFMEASGRNRTPDKLSALERQQLYEACDAHLRKVVEWMQPSWLIGIGKFAASRAVEAGLAPGVNVEWILHPSPASPAANRDWAGMAERKLIDIGVWSDR